MLDSFGVGEFLKVGDFVARAGPADWDLERGKVGPSGLVTSNGSDSTEDLAHLFFIVHCLNIGLFVSRALHGVHFGLGFEFFLAEFFVLRCEIGSFKLCFAEGCAA